MNSWEWKLKLISHACQAYFFFFSFLAFAITLFLTLPFVCDDDLEALLWMRILAGFLFFNMGINYLFVKYKSRYSVFKPSISDSSHFAVKDKNIFGYRLQGGDEGNIENGNQYPDTSQWHLDQQSKNISNQYQSYFTYNSDYSDVQNPYNAEVINKKEHIFGNKPSSSQKFDGWRYCKDCEHSAPPRSKHCPVCKACILKRDHHCFFVGCCVGYHNQRYFTIFCLYGGLGTLYSSLALYYYLELHYKQAQTWGCLSYFPLMILYYWVTSNISGTIFSLVIFQYLSIATILFCFFYLCVQVFLTYSGQTRYECMKGIKLYKRSRKKNIESVFGKFWIINFLLPIPCFGYSGNGIDWDDMLNRGKIL
ncbi:probable palmitoyltransferase ZDHHC24 [Physella acuta]|uniref:probable palmitoyltransferase ZDHHC24 n=1 Tax=Physella acuta TaxID=109671 RepID=UPI0027DD4E4F|nr:probable palmitoyltransferase ZDHHC24 [Physella acuta]XP_059172900.1 probable palmitoyltransferase ZDHHC24 [Physella acuta]